jgi:hypothetical protein
VKYELITERTFVHHMILGEDHLRNSHRPYNFTDKSAGSQGRDTHDRLGSVHCVMMMTAPLNSNEGFSGGR